MLVDVGLNCYVALAEIAFVHEGQPPPGVLVTVVFPGKSRAIIYLRDGRTAPCYISAAALAARIRAAEAPTNPDIARTEYRRGRQNGYASGYSAGQKRAQRETTDEQS